MDAVELRNRLLIAANLWREATGEPLPKLAAGDPALQIEAFELTLIERLCADATPDSAKWIADRTWDMVHDRPDSDTVKQRVVQCHEQLAEMRTRRGGQPGA